MAGVLYWTHPVSCLICSCLHFNLGGCCWNQHPVGLAQKLLSGCHLVPGGIHPRGDQSFWVAHDGRVSWDVGPSVLKLGQFWANQLVTSCLALGRHMHT